MLDIYTVTTIPFDYPSRPTRCLGWFNSCEDAFNEVRNNSGDMFEDGHYRYAVVEEVAQGIYTFPRKEFWFEWNEGRVRVSTPSPGYVRIEKKPKRFNQTVCFSMG
ncbi:MAG: hypothetical protein ACTSRU_18060 [Candidatus Hodarchaeales archaeon]